MAMLPIDIQVNMQQLSTVADQAAADRQGTEQAKREQAREWIQQRRLEQNTSDESAQKEDKPEIGEEEEGSSGNQRQFAGEQTERDAPPGRFSEPGKGNYFDILT